MNQDVYSIYILLKIAVDFCSKPCSQNTQECDQPPPKKKWGDKEKSSSVDGDIWRLTLQFLDRDLQVWLNWLWVRVLLHPASASKITTCLGSGIPQKKTFIYATGRGFTSQMRMRMVVRQMCCCFIEVVNSAIAQYSKGVFEAEGATSE